MIFDKIKDIDLFHPYILILLMIIFVLISLPIHFTNYSLLPTPSIILFLYIFLGFLFYFLGIIFSKLLFHKLNFIKKLKSLQLHISSDNLNHQPIHNFKGYLKELPLYGNYSKLEFDIGHVDGSAMANAGYEIYLDNNDIQSLEINANDLPIHISLDVSNCKQFKICHDKSWYNGEYAIVNGVLYT